MLSTASVALFVLVMASGCSWDEWERVGWPAPTTKQGENMLHVWQGFVIPGLAVLALIWGLILWSVVRYRKKNDDLPKQVYYNVPLEVIYTVVPFISVLVLFFFTAKSEVYVDKLSDRPDVTIGVVGYQWNWQFNYINDGLQVSGRPGEPAQLILPTDRKVRFIESSPDVIHSFWVPAFLFKRDVIPGRANQFEITITKPGTYIGRCAEFCGVDHDRMNFSVKAVPPAEYDAFIASQKRAGTSAQAGSSQ